MIAEAESEPLELHLGTAFLTGYGISASARSGALELRDGLPDTPRFGRFYTADTLAAKGLRRVIIKGESGGVSLAAFEWLRLRKVPVLFLDSDGDLLASHSAAIHEDSRLLRRQAVDGAGAVGLVIARKLINQKMAAERSSVAYLGHAEAWTLGPLGNRSTFADMRVIEAGSSQSFWAALAPLPVVWVAADKRRVPDAWLQIGSRSSGIRGRNRKATSPFHACLNLAFAAVAAEAELACHALGLSPLLGVLHTDTPSRDSLAWDLIEPLRPAIVRRLIESVSRRPLTLTDFEQLRDGSVRLHDSLCSGIWVDMAGAFRKDVGRVAEGVAADLVAGSPVEPRTPLTHEVRLVSVALRRQMTLSPVKLAPLPSKRCPDCGGPTASGRVRCRPCYETWKASGGYRGVGRIGGLAGANSRRR